MSAVLLLLQQPVVYWKAIFSFWGSVIRFVSLSSQENCRIAFVLWDLKLLQNMSIMSTAKHPLNCRNREQFVSVTWLKNVSTKNNQKFLFRQRNHKSSKDCWIIRDNVRFSWCCQGKKNNLYIPRQKFKAILSYRRYARAYGKGWCQFFSLFQKVSSHSSKNKLLFIAKKIGTK